MIVVYAVDPTVLPFWAKNNLHLAVQHIFATKEVRRILKWPSTWPTRALQELNKAAHACSELEKKRAEILYRRTIRPAFVQGRSQDYNDGETWLSNAEHAFAPTDGDSPVRAIIATDNPREQPFVLFAHELGTEDLGPAPTMREVERKSEALVSALQNLLAHSREMHLVDPHWDPVRWARRKLFLALAHAMKDATTSTPKTLCIHSRANGEEAATRRYLQEAIAENMLPHLPPHSRLRVRRWKTKTTGRFHERQLLSDIGGVKFTDAIQEGPGFETLAWMPRDEDQRLFQKAREKFEPDAKSSDELILVDSFTWTFDADEAEWKLDYRENPGPRDDS